MRLNQVCFLRHKNRSTESVQICCDVLVSFAFNIVRRHELNIANAFGEDNLKRELIHNHIVIDMIQKGNLQNVIVAGNEEQFVRRDVVTQRVFGLPASEKWES